MTVLSICVPTRNRQWQCIETIRGFTHSLIDELDVEVVVSDNSDDRGKLEEDLNQLFHSSLPRWLKFYKLDTGEPVRSMRQNWEFTLNRAIGEWLVFIGDDDYVDPKIASLLSRLKAARPDTEYLGWSSLAYEWPGVSHHETTVRISLQTSLIDYPFTHAWPTVYDFHWTRPSSLMSPYHGAIARTLVDKVKAATEPHDVYFKHGNVDYITGWIGALLSPVAAYCNRPLSVVGASIGSNSAYSRTRGGCAEASRVAVKEQQHDNLYKTLDWDQTTKKGHIYSLTEYFYWLTSDFYSVGSRLTTVTTKSEGWEKRLKERAEKELFMIMDAETHQVTRSGLEVFLSSIGISLPDDWASHSSEPRNLVKGLQKDQLYVLNSGFKTTSAAEFYQVLDKTMLRPVDLIGRTVEFRQ